MSSTCVPGSSASQMMAVCEVMAESQRRKQEWPHASKTAYLVWVLVSPSVNTVVGCVQACGQ